jgi:Fic-DOC domain mobile mystery protein B
MTDLLFDSDDDANTPLTGEEREQLIPSYITTRAELNEAEHIGIAEATRWLFSSKRDIVSDSVLRELHKRMFSGVWRWAGQYRTSARNIGVDAYRIAPELRQLVDDVKYQIEHTSFEPDEIAVRLSHRLVWVHAFANGNGRHSRLAADYLVTQLGQPRFSWGQNSLIDADTNRSNYVSALRLADKNDMSALLAFARS